MRNYKPCHIVCFAIPVLISGCMAATEPKPAVPLVVNASVVTTQNSPLHWVRDSSEYEATTRTVYRAAQALVETLPDLCQNPDASKKWVVVADADETLLDNSVYQIESLIRGSQYNDADWNAWVGRGEEGVVPGAAEFVAAVGKRCGSVVVVTNRKDSNNVKLPVDECAQTRKRLKELFGGVSGQPYPIGEVMCATTDANGKASHDKNERFKAIEGGKIPALGKVTVSLYIGDSITDFPGLKACNAPAKMMEVRANFGTRYFQLPNPMYGGWPGCAARK